MDFYVDNVDGNDTNDGHYAVTPLKTIAEIENKSDYVTANAPFYIYVKATGVDYDDFWLEENDAGSADNDTIEGKVEFNRWPEDSGTSRPVISAGDSTNSVMTVNADHVVVKNMHLKGKQTSGFTADRALLRCYRTSDYITVEDCIFQQRYHEGGIRANIDHPLLTVRRCYFYLPEARKEEGNSGLSAVVNDTDIAMYGATLENNIFENYPVVALNLEGVTNVAVTIDHNTFIECGWDISSHVIRVSSAIPTLNYTNNIVTKSGGNATADGIYLHTGSIDMVNADYNSWYGIDDPYDLYSEPTAANDVVGTEPEMICLVEEWDAAHIVLSGYYVPHWEQTALTEGSSTGGTIGAIAVTVPSASSIESSLIYDNSGTNASPEYYIVNASFEDKMFAFSHGRGAQGARFMYELQLTASRTKRTEFRALAIDWLMRRKLKRRYGG